LRPLTTAELLQVWEKGLNQTMLDKTLGLLAMACSANDPRDIGHLSIGERDARLLQLREWTFGQRLQNVTTCPQCNESVEWESDLKDLYLQPILPGLSVKTFVLEKDPFHIRYRLPDSFDVLKAVSNKEEHKKILANCLLEIHCQDEICTTDDLYEEIWVLLNDRMAQEDPQANIRINLSCPSCSYKWDALFDIVSFFWAEINNWAKRIMQEVCLLARAFGWSEKDILSMGSYRRQLYIQMIGK
jgi:T4 bacteriophage base plate protein.